MELYHCGKHLAIIYYRQAYFLLEVIRKLGPDDGFAVIPESDGIPVGFNACAIVEPNGQFSFVSVLDDIEDALTTLNDRAQAARLLDKRYQEIRDAERYAIVAFIGRRGRECDAAIKRATSPDEVVALQESAGECSYLIDCIAANDHRKEGGA